MMERFRTYMVVGGMPQAVEAYMNGESFKAVDKVKRNIIKLYENENLRIKMGEKAKEICIKEFDRKNSYGSIVDLINELTNKE